MYIIKILYIYHFIYLCM